MKKIRKDIKSLTDKSSIAHFPYIDAIVQTVREPLVILDIELRVNSSNKSFLDTFKLTPDETYNKNIFDLSDKQWDVPELRKLLEMILLKNSQFKDYHLQSKFKGVGVKSLLLNARSIVFEGFRTQFILLCIEDTTYKRNVESGLKESEEHYRSIVEQVRDHLIYTLDTDGNITSWNKAAEDITGFGKDDVLGRNHCFLYTPEDISRNMPNTILEAAKLKGKAINEALHMKKNGQQFWGAGVITPVKDVDGKLRGFSKVMQDVTARKQQEQLRDEFMHLASHELKTPITSIKAYIKILQKSLAFDKEPMNIRILTKINFQIDKITNIINNFLDLSKIEAGKMPINKIIFDIDKLITNIISDLQLTTIAHKIKKVGAGYTPICADPELITQVIINLITNAIKYSPEGNEIIVNLESDSNSVTIGVQDFGIGIAGNKLNRVFDKYYQVSEKNNAGNRGFGMGLYINSEIIKRHKGKIWVESTLGSGSTFSFTLPVQ